LSSQPLVKYSTPILRRGTLPPKAAEQEEAMLGKMPDAVVAEKTGRKLSAVTGRRHLLRIENG
jgi:hypothetical protein